MKEIGDILEEHLKKNFDLRKTNNSGAVSGDGDLSGKMFCLEAKATEAASISIKLSIWNKIAKEASDQDKIPMLVIGFVNKNTKKVDQSLSVLDIHTLKYLMTPSKMWIDQVKDYVTKSIKEENVDDNTIKIVADAIEKVDINL